MCPIAYIGLGSNLGNRRRFLDQALHALNATSGIRVGAISSYQETVPAGGPPGQGLYLNAAARLDTELSPADLLARLLAVETTLGRVRIMPNGPRTIDLDLLLYDDAVIDEPGLTVPHPRLQERSFMLGPLAELVPELIHPLLQEPIEALWVKRAVCEAPPPAQRELHGRKAVITGSTSGIGKAIALALAAGGANVVIHGRSADRAHYVADLARRWGVDAAVCVFDLQASPRCQALVEETAKGAPIDIWINNAGADTLTGAVAQAPFEEKLRLLLAVDLSATITLSRLIGARMRDRGAGVILNMGWDYAEHGMAGDSGELFSAVKGGIMGFTKSLALSLAPAVRVNCLAPGWMRTAWGRSASAAWQQKVRAETPLARWGTPQDVAAAARWLVSAPAAFITGQVIRINGGTIR